MVIKELKYTPYELKFSKPFTTSKTTYKTKKIIILKLRDELGNIGYGECAPLHEFGTETADDVASKLGELRQDLSIFSKHRFGLDAMDNSFKHLNDFPSLRFGLEQAFFQILFKRDNNFFKKKIDINLNKKIEINSVVGFGTDSEILKQIEEFVNDGFRTIKLKCGRKNFEDDYKIISLIKSRFENKIKLRIDINGNWIYKNAIENLNKLKNFDIEYAEQPVNNREDLIKLCDESPIPIAADESLKSINDALFLTKNGIKFLILKPTVVGGIINSLKIIKEAGKKNANVIISTAFESALGRNALLFLASLTKHNYAHGLGIANLFKNDFPNIAPPIIKNKIDFDIENIQPGFEIGDLI